MHDLKLFTISKIFLYQMFYFAADKKKIKISDIILLDDSNYVWKWPEKNEDKMKNVYGKYGPCSNFIYVVVW